MSIEWKWIRNYEDLYQVSNTGSIRSFHRDIEGTVMSTNPTKVDGYCRKVLFNLDSNGKAYLIHRLVAEAFIDNPENKSEVNHLDLDKTNNNISNLEWSTPSENTNHAFNNREIRRFSGEDNCRAILKNKDIKEIRRLYATGDYRYKDIGDIFNVNYNTIGSIIRNKTWRTVQ